MHPGLQVGQFCDFRQFELILEVDDLRVLLRGLVESFWHEFATVGNPGNHALELSQSTTYEMLLLDVLDVAVDDAALQVAAEDVLESPRAHHLLGCDQWKLAPLAQDISGHPIRVSIHSCAVFFAILAQLGQVGLRSSSLDHVVVSSAQDFPPKSDAARLVLHCQRLYHLIQVKSRGLSNGNACSLQGRVFLHQIGSLIRPPIFQTLQVRGNLAQLLHILLILLLCAHLRSQLPIRQKLLKLELMLPQKVRENLHLREALES